MGAPLSFEQYRTVVHFSNMPRDARASRTLQLLFTFMDTVAHDSFYSDIGFTPKKGARVLPAFPLPPYDTPRISRDPHHEGERC